MSRLTDNVTGRTPFVRMDINNRGWIRAIATTGATVNVPMRLIFDDNGWRSVPLAASTSVKQFMVGVWPKTVTTGDVGDVQIIGPISGIISTALGTTGYCLAAKYNSTVISSTGTYSGMHGEFAVCRNVCTLASTSLEAYMTGQCFGWLVTS